jgi:hypothetical protein
VALLEIPELLRESLRTEDLEERGKTRQMWFRQLDILRSGDDMGSISNVSSLWGWASRINLPGKFPSWSGLRLESLRSSRQS